MGHVRIVTDSTSDISQDVREHYGIEMVPLRVQFGQEIFEDSITITAEQFYEKLAKADKLPKTSQPSPAQFLDVFKRLNTEPGTQIISIHVSTALSGTYQSALLAINMLKEEGAVDITIVDSKSASYGLGFVVVEAAKMAAVGHTKEEILAMIERYHKECKLYFLVDSLEFLHKGGRIGRASALFGTLLHVKPILSVNHSGEVYAVDKARGHKRAVARILELLQRDYGDQAVHVIIGYTSNRAITDELTDAVKRQFNVQSLLHRIVGPATGTHVGTNVAAVLMLPAHPESV